MAAKKGPFKKTTGKANPAMDFLIDFMKRNPKAVYADAAAAAKSARMAIYPIMWGRAQVLLGRVAQKPRGQGKAAKMTAAKTAKASALAPAAATATAMAPIVKRGPGRPPKIRPVMVTTSGRAVSIPVANADLAQMQQLVDALNGGGKAMLRYDGNGWSLAVG